MPSERARTVSNGEAAARVAVVRELAPLLLSPLVRRFPVADLFVENIHELTLFAGPDRTVPLSSERFEQGAALRVVGNGFAAMGWTTDVSLSGIVRAAKAAGIDAAVLPSLQGAPSLRCQISHLQRERSDRLRQLLEELVADTQASAGSGAPPIQGSIELRAVERTVARSPQVVRGWKRQLTVVRLFTTRRDGSTVARSHVLSAENAPSYFDPRAFSHRFVATILEGSSAPRTRLSGTRPVVLGPAAGAVFFHEVLGHGLEADHVLNGASPFARCKMGDPIAAPFLTIVDSPAPSLGCGWIEWDDEGSRPQAVTLLREGRIAGMLHDRVSARMTGHRPTGNARRESFRHEPEPRLRNVVVRPGRESPEALLSGIRSGLYVERLGQSRTDLTASKFTLGVAAGRWIRNGRLDAAIDGAVLRGDMRAALAGVEGVGCDFAVAAEPAPCGKHGVVMTGIAGPTVRLGRVEVLSCL